MLLPLGQNGGATFTHLPQPGSPVIDQGNCAGGTDQRGATRPIDIASSPNGGGNACDIGSVEVQSVPNLAPTAGNNLFSTPYETQLIITKADLIANDSDPENDFLTILNVSNTAVANQPLSGPPYVYNPPPGYSGPDYFTYQVWDGELLSNTASVFINVAANTNLRPNARNDTYGTPYETGLVVDAASGILSNDDDPNGDPFTMTLISNVINGTLNLNTTDGSFTYTPDIKFSGVDVFTYRLFDGELNSRTASVVISVGALDNEPPIAVDDSYTTDYETILTVLPPGVVNNDTDVNGDILGAQIVTQPVNGTVSLNADGSFTYTPNFGFFGVDLFTYNADDGVLLSEEPGRVTIEVLEPDEADAPPPPVPKGLSILGSLVTAPLDLTFVWGDLREITGPEAPTTEYILTILDDMDLVILEATFFAIDICEFGTCAVPLDDTLLPGGLLNGVYRWSVQSRVDGVTSFRSDELTFQVNVPPPSLPLDSFTVTTTGARPTIIWPNEGGSSWMQFWIGQIYDQVNPDTNETETIVITSYINWHSKAEMCDETTCSFTADIYPFNGDYTVYMQAWGPAGLLESALQGWFGPLHFTLDFDVPGQATPLTPTNINSGTPTYHWEYNAGTQYYYLEITNDDTGEIVHANWYNTIDIGCPAGGTCHVTPLMGLLNNTTYSWRVLAYGPAGFALINETEYNWAVGNPFTVMATDPPAPQPLTPTLGMTVTTSKPTYYWTHSQDASFYYVEVDVNPNSPVPFIQEWYFANDLGCQDDNVCALKITTPALPDGDYQWRVVAYNPAGFSPISDWEPFVVKRE